MSTSAAEFEKALRSHLNTKFLNEFPPEFLKMRVGEFLQLISVQQQNRVELETPRTATRRSVRQQQQQHTGVLSSITKSVKRTLFPLRTPSKKITEPATPSAQTPHLTIKPTHNTIPNTTTTPSKRVKPSQTPRNQPTTSAASPSTTGIVQFQLDDGKVIDVDFSRSPKSALQEANLLGSEAIGEVKAKIETYANQFMQYLKFFKKFKPN